MASSNSIRSEKMHLGKVYSGWSCLTCGEGAGGETFRLMQGKDGEKWRWRTAPDMFYLVFVLKGDTGVDFLYCPIPLPQKHPFSFRLKLKSWPKALSVWCDCPCAVFPESDSDSIVVIWISCWSFRSVLVSLDPCSPSRTMVFLYQFKRLAGLPLTEFLSFLWWWQKCLLKQDFF